MTQNSFCTSINVCFRDSEWKAQIGFRHRYLKLFDWGIDNVYIQRTTWMSYLCHWGSARTIKPWPSEGESHYFSGAKNGARPLHFRQVLVCFPYFSSIVPLIQPSYLLLFHLIGVRSLNPSRLASSEDFYHELTLGYCIIDSWAWKFRTQNLPKARLHSHSIPFVNMLDCVLHVRYRALLQIYQYCAFVLRVKITFSGDQPMWFRFGLSHLFAIFSPACQQRWTGFFNFTIDFSL